MRQHKGIISLDFLFSIIPVLLMLVYILSYSSYIIDKSQERIENQILFDELVSISDYAVKYKGAEQDSTKVYPNLIDGEVLAQVNLEKYNIGFNKEGENCIYRFVIYQDKIEKLYVCSK